MKTLLIIIIISLVSTICFSQVIYIDGKAIMPEQDWKNFKTKALTLYYDNEAKDSVIQQYEMITKKQDSLTLLYESIIRNDSTIIEGYKKINSSEPGKEGFLQWQGLYAGLQPFYQFGTEYVKFSEGIRFSIFVNARLRIGSYIIEPEFLLPLNKEAGQINIKIGKKIL